MENAVKIAVIGGSGLYQMPGIEDVHQIEIETPFGKPSGPVTVGNLRGKRVAFLPRHGVGHVLSPGAIPQKANIYALKTMGVRFCIAVNACGSLREDYRPGDIVIPDQLLDYCIGLRDRSFFERGLVAHISVAEPFDNYLRGHLVTATREAGGTVHDGGTFLVEDGPRFATRAESLLFRQWQCDIIGMTTIPEAFLAREAEIAYATMAHITDYDSWREETEVVTVDTVVATFGRNIQLAQKAITNIVEQIDPDVVTPAHSALTGAIMTDRRHMDPAQIGILKPLVARALELDSDA